MFAAIVFLRRHVKTLRDHHYNRSAAPGAWTPLGAAVPPEDREAVEATFCRLEPADLARALNALVVAYRRVAPAAAAAYGLRYPDALDRTINSIVGETMGTGGSG